ncbi:hypothetical protein F5144DRAFT_401172 [Chaetomium tenue]|uniref:Uncharacterized protein n=1 Tax=Chaetomium tenue TaxID=1854479 RepID=A0ACB7NVP9_9PEZI|nr:hypothetical protein F5144DRAFT_401172 [Chaetomium globosum]
MYLCMCVLRALMGCISSLFCHDMQRVATELSSTSICPVLPFARGKAVAVLFTMVEHCDVRGINRQPSRTAKQRCAQAPPVAVVVHLAKHPRDKQIEDRPRNP